MEQSELVADRYAIRTFLGSGSFSAVYRGVDLRKQKPVAIKIEALAYRYRSRLRHEAQLMQSQLADVKGVPHLKWQGEHKGQYTVVMSLVGQNAEDLLSLCNWKFSVKTTLMIADQLLARLRDVHAKGVVHRDIKHDNVAIGEGKQSSMLFLIDFGLSLAVTEAPDGNNCFAGNLSFASISSQRNNPQTYRDDLESLAYLLVYFLKGALPWSQMENLDPKHIESSVLALKLKVTNQSLCRDLPIEFEHFLEYAKVIPAGEMPNYTYLKDRFAEAGRRMNIRFDRRFDWVLRVPDGRDPILSLKETKERWKTHREHSKSKLFRSSSREIHHSETQEETEETQQETVDIVEKPKAVKSKKPRKTIEDAEGPTVSQGLRDYINRMRS